VGGREHGTRARYAWGPDEHDEPGIGCRCGRCTNANRAEAAHRSRMIAYGRWQPYVDAGPAREHVRTLAGAGIGWKRAAGLAGVSTGSMSKLVYGGPGNRPPARRIRPETAARILAVRAAPEALGGAALVDATGTRRRLQALVACGYSKSRLAERLGMLPGNFAQVMTRGQVQAGTERAVRALYDGLWDVPPGESGHRERISVSRAGRYARERGWAVPMAWDDEALDDPAARPAADWRRREHTASPPGGPGREPAYERFSAARAAGMKVWEAAVEAGASQGTGRRWERARKAELARSGPGPADPATAGPGPAEMAEREAC